MSNKSSVLLYCIVYTKTLFLPLAHLFQGHLLILVLPKTQHIYIYQYV